MVKLLKFLAYILFFIFALIYFLPKQSLYYFAEQELQKQQVILSNEEISEKTFSLELQHSNISYQSISSAEVAYIDVQLLFFYNVINLHDIRISSVASTFIPLNISSVKVKHTLLNPLNILFRANGEFGEAEGVVHILDRNMSLILKPSPLMLKEYSSTLRELNKNEKGEYQYDQTF